MISISTPINVPGNIVQVVYTQTGDVAIGTTLMPVDDTIPQNNEGDEYMSLAITPRSATNLLKIEVVFQFSHSLAGAYEQVALFRDAIVNALSGASNFTATSALAPRIISFTTFETAGTTSEIIFKVRAGGDSGSTTTFNGIGGNRRLGGAFRSSITITEVKAN